MARIRNISLAIAGAFLLSNCASIVSDNDSTTYVETDPEEARCELHGQDFKRLIRTPNSINLPAEAAPITIACKADGYRSTVQELDTSMDGWIIGNLLFGGIIGIAVDAARGAGQKYPSHVMVFLEPEAFTTGQARDEWYDRRRQSLEDKWDKTTQTIRQQCVGDKTSGDCLTSLNKADEQREKEIQELEERRSRARIEGT